MTTSRTAFVLTATLVLSIGLGGCATSKPAAPAPSSSETDGYRLVGLGDSVPGAGGDCSAPCASYVIHLGAAAASLLGAPVAVTNLATKDSATSGSVLERVSSDSAMRAAVSKADIVTLTVGFNDWQGPCDWAIRESCLKSGQGVVTANIALILKKIMTLRSGKPTAIRVTDYYNNTIGSAESLSSWGVPTGDEVAFVTFYATALASFNSAICATAEAGGAKCVDLVTSFNGPTADQDPGDLLGPDHLHPSTSGHQLLAKLIADSGFDELH